MDGNASGPSPRPRRPPSARGARLGVRGCPETNLPAQLTSFIGRRSEVDEVRRLLGDARLVTLTGAGGIGKTRLAQEVAASLVPEYEGVYLVELAPLADARLVPQAVASILGVRESGPRPILETMLRAIGERRLLIVLDNCEHLCSACAELVDTLLRGCPGLRVLATSRQPLGIVGETKWRVPSLALPDAPSVKSSDAVLKSEAVRLFVDRASAVLPTFALTSENAPAIARICSDLDGVPLAIELAAVWVNVLSVHEIAERLSDRFQLLARGGSTTPPRHQTLRGALDWSYELLGEIERVLLRRLAVFEGGCTLEAAEAVCSGAPIDRGAMLDVLAQLVDKSLVIADAQCTPARYRLLETTRQYSLRRLREFGEETELRRVYAAFYLGLAKRAQPELLGPNQVVWLERLNGERNNLRAALRWSLQHDAGYSDLDLAAALWDFWWMRGYITEGLGWLDDALARGSAKRSPARAHATHGAGLLRAIRGDLLGGAAQFADAAIQFFELDHVDGAARPIVDLGTSAWLIGDARRARAIFEAALALARDVDNRWVTAYALYALGNFLVGHEQYEAAAPVVTEGIAAWRAIGDLRGLAHTLYVQAGLERGRGDVVQATGFARESLHLFQELGEVWGILNIIIRLAAIARTRSDADRAGRLLGAADTLAETIGVPLEFPLWRIDIQAAISLARKAPGEDRFQSARLAGRSMPLDAAIAYALSAPVAPDAERSEQTSPGLLSPREREIAVLIARGFTNRQIAETLMISELTVDTHVRNMLRKLEASSRAQIASWATAQGLLAR